MGSRLALSPRLWRNSYSCVTSRCLMFQPQPNSQRGAVTGGVDVSLHPPPRPGGLRHAHLCAHGDWHHVESPAAGNTTHQHTFTDCLSSLSQHPPPCFFMRFVSHPGLHGREHHVEPGWPVDHAAEGPIRAAGTGKGDTCQQQEAGEYCQVNSNLAAVNSNHRLKHALNTFSSWPSSRFVLRWCSPSVWRTCGPLVAPTERSATCWRPCGCPAARRG